MGHYRHRSRVADDFAPRGRAIGVSKLVDPHAGHRALPDRPRVDALHLSPSPPAKVQDRSAASSTIASQTASICTIRSAATLSCAVWFASVPFASSTHSNPAALRAFASLPPR